MGWMTAADAGAALGLEATAVAGLVARGQLDAARGSEGALLLDPDDVRALLLVREHERRARSSPGPSASEPGEVRAPPSSGPDDRTDERSLAGGSPPEPRARAASPPSLPDDRDDRPAPPSQAVVGASEHTGGVDAPDDDEGAGGPSPSGAPPAPADPVARGRLAARVILALEDEIDVLTEAVREAALALAAASPDPPDARQIGAVLGVAPTAVTRLLAESTPSSDGAGAGTSAPDASVGGEVPGTTPPAGAASATDPDAHAPGGDTSGGASPIGEVDGEREGEADDRTGTTSAATVAPPAGCLGALWGWALPRPSPPSVGRRLPLVDLVRRLLRR